MIRPSFQQAWLTMLVVFACTLLAAAQQTHPPLAAASTGPAGGASHVASHAWLVTPAGNVRGGLVWHLPPRGGALQLGAAPGVLRLASELSNVPVAVGAVGDRLYMIFEEQTEMPSGRPREVMSIFAVPSGDGVAAMNWLTRPVGSFDAAPSLRADGRVLACAGGGGRLFVLMHGLRDHQADPERLHLFAMNGETWSETSLPDDLVTSSRALTVRRGNKVAMEATWWMWGTPDGIGVAVEESGELRVWSASMPPVVHASDLEDGSDLSPPNRQAAWRSLRLPSPASEAGMKLRQVLSVDDELHAVVTLGVDRTFVRHWIRSEGEGRGGWANLSDVAMIGSFAGSTIVGRAASGLERPSLALITEGQGRSGPDGMALGGGRMMTEISLATGRLLSCGPVAPQNPVSASDYRLMGLMFLLVGSMVAIFLARPPGDADASVSLPEFTAMADPMRRLIASLIDLLLACVLGTGLWKLPVRTLASAEWWGSSGSLTVLATILVILIVQGTLCEWFFRRTPGKLMSGCEVFAAGGTSGDESGRVGLIAALVRNIIKCIAPLVALIGILEPSRRHRGDQWSRTVVIERFEEDLPEE